MVWRSEDTIISIGALGCSFGKEYLHAVARVLGLEHDLAYRLNPLITTWNGISRQLNSLLIRPDTNVALPCWFTCDGVTKVYHAMRKIWILSVLSMM